MIEQVKIQNVVIGKGAPLAVMSGPCVIESRDHALLCAEFLVSLFQKLEIPFIFKASYDKANRSSIHSFRGPGIEEGLSILKEIKETFNVPVVSDVHTPEEIIQAKEVLDLIQIPAFLCRQTDLIVEAARSQLPLNVKKGQFMSPWEMQNLVNKVISEGNEQLILVDRGTSFGYNNLVSDMRSIAVMREMAPVCFDASHSVQLPGGMGTASGGQREFIPTLAKAAVAAGAHALFIESHPNPQEAKSDAATVFDFKDLEKLMKVVKQLHEVVS